MPGANAPVICPSHRIQGIHMGKGDQRSKKGKLYRGTHGKTRPKKAKKGKKAKQASKKA